MDEVLAIFFENTAELIYSASVVGIGRRKKTNAARRGS